MSGRKQSSEANRELAREHIAQVVAHLDDRLERVSAGLEKALGNGDLDAVRGGCVLAIQDIEETLTLLLGARALWSLRRAIDILEYAGHGKRHWLVALPNEKRHTRLDAPNRLILQSQAAAIVDYFNETLPSMTQKQVAERVVKAMSRGRFCGTGGGPPSARTVQDWRAKCLPGSKNKPASPKMREMFEVFNQRLADGGKQASGEDYFHLVLEQLTQNCWECAEI